MFSGTAGSSSGVAREEKDPGVVNKLDPITYVILKLKNIRAYYCSFKCEYYETINGNN